jgi:hypothetical protein
MSYNLKDFSNPQTNNISEAVDWQLTNGVTSEAPALTELVRDFCLGYSTY